MNDWDDSWSQMSGYSAVYFCNFNLEKKSKPLLDFIEGNRHTITSLTFSTSKITDVDFLAIFGIIAERLNDLWLCDVEIAPTEFHNRLRKYKLPKLTALSIQYSSDSFSFTYIASVLHIDNVIHFEYYDFRSDQQKQGEDIAAFIASREHLEKITIWSCRPVLSMLANHRAIKFKAKELLIKHSPDREPSAASITLVDHLVRFFRRQWKSLKRLTLSTVALSNAHIAELMMLNRLEHLVVDACSFIPSPVVGVVNYSIHTLHLSEMKPDLDFYTDRSLFDILRSCRDLKRLILDSTAITNEMSYVCNTYCKKLVEIVVNGALFVDLKAIISSEDIKSYDK